MNKHTWLVIYTLTLALVATENSHAEDATAKSAKLYDTYCAQCHGVNRDGNGINSKFMAVKPRDHTDASMGDTPDSELRMVIHDGGPSMNKSVLMPKWGGVLTDAEIDDMVKYLRVVSKTSSK